ncbi:DEAD/DEAH box helicase [Microlunatus elymi]|uniref:DEAD/DEAH box helicase n=1 Tax=Microlunatus elymi TaxID=2596828 RepID=A0A516Q6N4_9ACTN|nr:DEAD/DEAH box helicase [Microlunatus elymi]
MAGFTLPTRTWFAEVFEAPTSAQSGAWEAISAGHNALVIAPTGSGKTLAAFLWALDGLARTEPPPSKQRCRVLYVSPLKALAVDVERNLRAPLTGIARTAERLGAPVPDIRVGVRSGDTPASDRRKLASKPPDIMITTPESLFLMLTSGARDILRQVETVIVDEVHALAGTKRGAHLAISLERLEELIGRTAEDAGADHRPVQRIGLSATVRPPERVAAFLGGRHPVQVVAPPAEKNWDLQIVVPVEDMAEVGAAPPRPISEQVGTAEVLGSPAAPDPKGAAPDDLDPYDLVAPPPSGPPSIWPHVETRILDLILDNRSSIVFANSRRLAERLTAHLNELYAERLGVEVPDSVRPPAQVMAQSGASKGQDGSGDGGAPVIAKAHHGSVSKEQRAIVEDDLKSGRLRCVVATSSLELGIDMGAVDIVIQVESPPSVASGLQRVGRAGHQVGAISRGVFFPDHRGDLIESTVVATRMRDGQIEEVARLHNPLDVLAQQIVAIVSDQDIDADRLFDLVRRADGYAELPRSAYEAVLDMLSGRYPSEDFAELRPRLIWHRDTNQLQARPGAQRLVVTSGGTIPDRGLFGVFLVGEGAGRRVGELDEEMVYESRVGDVITLGTTSWRIEAITHDQVQVSPAPGVPGRLPFWKGDAPARPAELGRALGGFVREIAAQPTSESKPRLLSAGLDEWAADNLLGYVHDQQSATRGLPTDREVIFERFRDELGDWRVCVHTPLGSAVHAPWALAIEAAARERYGVDASATATNDGIVLRIPDTESEPPGAELIISDPDTLEQIVTDEVGGSALFASRFRECAARALLLPRRDPRSRSPLWQQRMRSAQLLGVATRYPEFPIVLETMRECLTDVFDLESLLDVQRRIAARQIKIVEVETKEPSPFARTLLFGYVGEFVYEGDVPLAEKKAAALSLDAGLLAELLGKDGLQQLLDAEVITEVEADLQSLSIQRRAGRPEQLFDLIRTAGPFDHSELAARVTAEFDLDTELAGLINQRRVVEVRIAGDQRYAVIEDLPRLRDGLGIPLPPGTAADVGSSGDQPVTDLVLRWARTHGPFLAQTVADRYGLGVGVISSALQDLIKDGTVVTGTFTAPAAPEHGEEPKPDPDGPAHDGGPKPGHARQYCHQRNLALIKRRTLAKLRQGIEPVDQVAYQRFLLDWQGIGSGVRGPEAVLSVLEQLAGYPLPASAIESVILPARVADYQPAMLDELTSSGELLWIGDGAIGDADGWVRFYPQDADLPDPGQQVPGPLAAELMERLESGGGFFFDNLLGADLEPGRRGDYVQALWDLVWSGHITGDTFAPVRALTTDGTMKRPATPRARLPQNRLRGRGMRPRFGPGSGLSRRPPRPGFVASSPTTAGRWSAVPRIGDVDQRARFAGQLFAELDRYGVLTRGSVLNEEAEGGFGAAYRGLSTLEESGQCRRGYYIDGLGAAQFAVPGAIDRLRDHQRELDLEHPRAVVLAATDPANAYGAALPWPRRAALRADMPGRAAPGIDGSEREGHRPGRKAGALVVLVDGLLALYVERGGRTLLTFTEADQLLRPATAALAAAVLAGHLGRVTIERANGDQIFTAGRLSELLQEAGFRMTPQGLRLRPDPSRS